MSFDRFIVLDTGVLVSAAIRPDSVPALALEKALLQFDVCASKEALAELETVLSRPKFDRYASKQQRAAFFEGFRQQVVLFEVIRVVTDCTDPKDSKFLALADTAQAELIISSDVHLTGMHPWREIPIMPPAAFLVGIR
ncbi:MAG: putative toxin-antitoxin system toxin component, PIN family [Rhodocyclaceae bacterium]|jgi:putative PIN family toxin of toxin-antitoxin system|nr:putative toxin-antitoxin system toxin component, PIN family [Rhodocyclaceae bacterium]MBK6908209.1 putative toxin-antitoxin system toxin component, PIN family [Rhodocyclaceae bacterium]